MEPLRVLTAINQPVVITERRCGLLEVQKSKTNCNAVVMPGMLNGVDLILGVDWMHEHDAVLKVKHGVCTLFEALGESGKPVNLFALQPKHLPGFAAVAAMKEQWDSAAEIKLVCPGQAVRQLRKGCSSWLMLVKPGDAGDQLGWHQGSLAAACHKQCYGLLSEYADVFGDMPPGLPPNRPVGHTIRTPPGAEAPYKRMHKLSPREEAEVKKQVAELLAKGLIEPSSSPYGAPTLFVQKKDGSLRMCIDYRALNKLTVRDRYPLPRIDDLFDKLAGKRVFSSLDLQSGYHQIRITEEDVPKTDFLTPMGQFQFKVLCFGLTNAPATFQRMMNNVFKPLINECVLVYIDDILVMSNTPEEHVQHLRQVLQLMRENKFYAKLAKWEFNKTQLAFLGHIVGSKGIAVDPAKVQVVKEWPTPRNLKDLQAFLGLANYFRRFISNFSSLAAPLTNLTSKQVAAAYDWEHFGGAELEAFNALKEALCSAPVLALPDFSKPFVVCTDASLVGTGGVLMQDGRPIAYTSKKMSPAETRYATGEQELLGIIRAVREWRCYLDGAVDVTILTDHNPLIYLQTQPNLSRRQVRWMEELSRYKYEIKYIPGATNVADPISRNPALGNEAAEAIREQAAAEEGGKAPPPLPTSPSASPNHARKTAAKRSGATAAAAAATPPGAAATPVAPAPGKHGARGAAAGTGAELGSMVEASHPGPDSLPILSAPEAGEDRRFSTVAAAVAHSAEQLRRQFAAIDQELMAEEEEGVGGDGEVEEQQQQQEEEEGGVVGGLGRRKPHAVDSMGMGLHLAPLGGAPSGPTPALLLGSYTEGLESGLGVTGATGAGLSEEGAEGRLAGGRKRDRGEGRPEAAEGAAAAQKGQSRQQAVAKGVEKGRAGKAAATAKAGQQAVGGAKAGAGAGQGGATKQPPLQELASEGDLEGVGGSSDLEELAGRKQGKGGWGAGETAMLPPLTTEPLTSGFSLYGAGAADGDAGEEQEDQQATLMALVQALGDDEGEEDEEQAQALQAMFATMMAKRAKAARARQAAIIKEVQAQLQQELCGVEEAVAAEAREHAALVKRTLGSLERQLQDKFEAIDAMHTQFTQQLATAWDQYSTMYTNLEGVRQKLAAVGARQRAAAKKKLAVAASSAQVVLEAAVKKAEAAGKGAKKMPGLAQLLQRALA
ncbi:hypothetical protein QJQ45_014272 [Haematococcus lacustris]|nr:hypothetical protein QJQ45_014272 [Haematococcus lacustris]